MQRYEVKQIGRGMYILIEENVCIYVVCGDKYAAVIDSGYGSFDLREAVSRLTPLPQILILTHGHPDHFLGAYFYEDAYLSVEDFEVFNKYNSEAFVSIYDEYTQSSLLLKNRKSPKLLPMENHFDLGGRILELVSLSGHTPGSVGLLLKEEGILFSGDGLTYCVWMQLEESSSVEEYLNVLYMLKKREEDFNLIFNGHCQDPSTRQHLDNVISLAEDVLENQPGIYLEQEGFPGYCACGDGCEMIYLKEKLFASKSS